MTTPMTRRQKTDSQPPKKIASSLRLPAVSRTTTSGTTSGSIKPEPRPLQRKFKGDGPVNPAAPRRRILPHNHLRQRNPNVPNRDGQEYVRGRPALGWLISN